MSYPSITPLLNGYQESPPNTALRTEMEQGPAKVRNRTTAGVRKLQLFYLLTAAEVATLETFFLVEAAAGAATFSFTHPRTSATESARFTEPPQYMPNGTKYNVSVSLEILP